MRAPENVVAHTNWTSSVASKDPLGPLNEAGYAF